MAAPIVHTLKWGIFNIAYEAKSRSFVPVVSLLAILRTVHDPEALLWRFFKDVYNIAPFTFLTYIAASIWLSINPALSLQLSYIILQKVRHAEKAGACDSERADRSFDKPSVCRTYPTRGSRSGIHHLRVAIVRIPVCYN